MKRLIAALLSAALCCLLPAAVLAEDPVPQPSAAPAAESALQQPEPDPAQPADPAQSADPSQSAQPASDAQPAESAPQPQPSAQRAAGYTGLRLDADGVWRYYTDGQFDTSKTGVVMYGAAWFYVQNGVMDVNFAGLVDYNGGTFYVSAGQVRTDLTRLVQNVDGRWYYLSSGQVRTDTSGRVWYNNACFVLKNGELDTNANGIILDQEDGHRYYVSYGQYQLELTGLVQDTDGSWYYISDGQVREDYSGLALYNDNWYVIASGRLDTSYNGFYPYNGELFVFTTGQMRIDFTGECQVEGYRCLLVCGQLRNVLPALHTPQEIRSFLASHPFQLNSTVTYAVTPSLSGNQPGSLSAATIQDGLNAVNYVRYVAGLPADVQIADEYMERAQAAAFVLAKNDTGLSHFPSNTSGIPDDLFQLGRLGTSSSNLAAQYGYGGYNLSQSIIEGYMDDGDISNIAMVGHRRWLLSTSLNHIGFGFCTAASSANYTATYVFDDLLPTTVYPADYVAWPAENMPADLLQGPWSISLSRQTFSGDLSQTWVRMTDLNTGRSWTFDNSTNSDPFNTSAPYYSRDTGNYGYSYALIFTPRVSFGSGARVQVEVYGLKEADTGAETSLSYVVNFF